MLYHPLKTNSESHVPSLKSVFKNLERSSVSGVQKNWFFFGDNTALQALQAVLSLKHLNNQLWSGFFRESTARQALQVSKALYFPVDL